MKVFLTIWILAVLIQEVVPSTLVRLPRNAEKNLSLVHTEYEAKYEQKGKHGNESFSTVSGKQEIVHDNCAENWNTFAEKCASLIKDLVASLANAVSSKPGDATNLQLHIKNTFRHFDHTHNCTCLNHSGNNLSDLDLSPLFNNITIKTVRPATKSDEKNPTANKNNKCGGTGQPCDGQQSSDSKSNKNVGIVRSGLNDPKSDKNETEQKQVKKCGQSGNEACDGHDDSFPEHHISQGHQKQLNRALADAKDLEMKPENAEGSSDDHSTNNSRRQIKYPPNLEKPRKISKTSDFSPDSNPKQLKNTKNVRYPFLVTPRPNPQSAISSESPAVALSPTSLSKQSLDSDSEPSSALLSEENSSATTNIPQGSSTAKRNNAPSPSSSVLTSPTNRNSSPNNFYLPQTPQSGNEPHSSSYNEEKTSYNGKVPKEVSPSNGKRMHEKPIPVAGLKSPSKLITNRNNQSPMVNVGEPVTERHVPEPEMPVPANAISRKPSVPAGEMVTDVQNSEPLKSSQSSQNQQNAHSPVTVPEDQIIDNYKAAPEESINKKQSEQPALIFQEEAVANKETPGPVFIREKYQNHQEPTPKISKSVKSSNNVPNAQSPEIVSEGQSNNRFNSNTATEMPLQSVDRQQSTVMHSENPPPDSPLSPEFIPENKYDHDSTPSVVNTEESNNNKPSEQPMIVFPEKSVSDNLEPAKEEPQPIVILPEGTKDGAIDPSAINSAVADENISEGHSDNQDSASPVFVRNEKPVEERRPEEASLTTIQEDPAQLQENPIFTMNKDSTKFNHPPNSHFNSNHPESLEPINKNEIINPSPESAASASSPSSKSDLTQLSHEDTLPTSTDVQTDSKQDTTTCAPTTTTFAQAGNDLDHTVSAIHAIPEAPEIANQQSEDTTPCEEHFQVTPTPISSHESPLIVQKFTEMPQKTQDTEVNDPEKHQWDSKQPIQKPTFSTPAPIYQGHIVTAFPDNQSKPKMTAEDYKPEEKQADETESPFPISPGNHNQSDMENITHETQNEHGNTPVHSDMKSATPMPFYPEKNSAEHPAQGNDNLEFTNNENQEPFAQEHFITPVPISTIKPNEIVPEEQTGNAKSPIETQSTATNEDSGPSYPTNLQEEHFITLSPTKSDDDEYPRVTAQSDNVTEKPIKPISDHPLQANDFSYVPPATTSSEANAISSEPHPETAVPPPVLKPSQPGALVSTTEAQPHQGEAQNLLIHPTTFQTTSEEPTPAQGVPSEPASLSPPTTSVPQDSDETNPVKPSTSPKTSGTHEHDDDDEEDCCSCESCTEEEITDPKQYRESACKNLEEARRELKAIFDKIKKKLKCGRKAPQAITAS